MSHAHTVTVRLTDDGQTHPTSLDLMNVYYSLFINETMKLYFLRFENKDHVMITCVGNKSAFHEISMT